MKRKLITFTNNYTETKVIGGLCFKKAGEFVFAGGHLQVNICRASSKDEHIVYAHVIHGEVVYIGESSDTFCNRIRLYLIHDGSTNVRVRNFLMTEILKGKSVDIYYYKPATITVDGVLKVNPYVGIEQALISLVRPSLNIKDVA